MGKRFLKRLVSQILVVLLAVSIFQIGSWWSKRSSLELPPAETVVPLVVYQKLAEKYREDVGGLRDRLAAKTELQPTRIQVVEVPVPVPDTVTEFIAIDPRGNATVGRITSIQLTGSEIKGRGEILQGIDVSQCDDGLVIGPRIVCNKPRFGHLYLFGEGALTVPQVTPIPVPGFWGMAGLEWERLYRSTWSIYIGADTEGRFITGLRKRLRIW